MRIVTIILFLLLSTQTASARSVYFGTPDQITNWVVSCSVDSGSIKKKAVSGFSQQAKIDAKAGFTSKGQRLIPKEPCRLKRQLNTAFNRIFE